MWKDEGVIEDDGVWLGGDGVWLVMNGGVVSL